MRVPLIPDSFSISVRMFKPLALGNAYKIIKQLDDLLRNSRTVKFNSQ